MNGKNWLEDALEEVEGEVHHDAVDEERGKREREMKEQKKERENLKLK